MRIQSARPLLTAVCTVAVAVSGIAFAALDPQKFVAGWRLDLTSEGAFYDVPLTHEVYQFGRSLNELAVLDANGEPMPFYRVAVPSAAVSEEYSTLGVSPIYVRQGDGAAADLRVTTQGDRTEVVVILNLRLSLLSLMLARLKERRRRSSSCGARWIDRS